MPYQPKKLSPFKKLVLHLRTAPAYQFTPYRGEIVADGELVLLAANAAANQTPKEAEYAKDPLPSVLRWLLRKDGVWKSLIYVDSEDSKFARGVIHLLEFHLTTYPYDPSTKSALTLLARRLIWLGPTGLKKIRQQGAHALFLSHGAWRLPKGDATSPYRQNSHRQYFVTTKRSTVTTFVKCLDRFIDGRDILPSDQNEESVALAEDRKLQFYLEADKGSPNFNVSPTSLEQNGFASLLQAQAAVTNSLAQDPRALVVTSELLKRENFEPSKYVKKEGERMKNRAVRVTAGLLSALTGMSPREIVDLSLLPPESKSTASTHFANNGDRGNQKVLGYICTESELSAFDRNVKVTRSNPDRFQKRDFFLLSYIGPSRNQGLIGRISDQYIVLPIPKILNDLIFECRNFCYEDGISIQTFGVLLKHDALDLIHYGLSTTFAKSHERYGDWLEKTFLSFLMHPDSAFRYVALTIPLWIFPTKGIGKVTEIISLSSFFGSASVSHNFSSLMHPLP